jgi:ClpP class serine protease
MLNGEYLLIKPSFLAQYCLLKNTEKDNELNYKTERFEEKKARVLNISSIDENGNGVINIEGPLTNAGPDDWDIYFNMGGTSYQNIINSLADLDSRLESDKKIILRMNTPGGEVNGVEVARNAILNTRNKRVVETDIKGLMASAGVWLGSASTKIMSSTESAMIGSIGVVVNYLDWSKAYEKFGIQKITITNHESPDKWPDLTTKKGQGIIQSELDDIYNIFSSHVIEGRAGKITQDQINGLNGRVLISQKAVDIGLIDEIKGHSIENKTINNDKNTVKTEEIIIESKLKTPEDSGKKPDGGKKIMTLDEIRANHPELYNQIVAIGIAQGIEQEYQRCVSYSDSAEKFPEGAKIYTQAIKDKKPMNDSSVQASIFSMMRTKTTVEGAAPVGDITTDKTPLNPSAQNTDKVEGGVNNDDDMNAMQNLIRANAGLDEVENSGGAK